MRTGSREVGAMLTTRQRVHVLRTLYFDVNVRDGCEKTCSQILLTVDTFHEAVSVPRVTDVWHVRMGSYQS